MAQFNKVIMAGHLTRDPQLSYLPSQTPVCDFGLAVNHVWKDQAGQKREDVCFIECRAFGRAAETLNQYMAKGNPILVEGRLRYEQWTGKDGGKRSMHRVVVDSFQFLGGGNGQRQPAKGSDALPTGMPRSRAEPPPPEEPSGGSGFPSDVPDNLGDDIPFNFARSEAGRL